MADLSLLEHLPGWETLTEEVNREKAAFGLALLLAVFMLYWTYSAAGETADLRERTDRFERTLATYMELRARRDLASAAESDTTTNPLAYLGEKARSTGVGEDRLTALTPSGEGPRGRTAYRVRFEGIPLRPALVLLRDLETERRMGVRELTIARVGVDAQQFDVTFRLLNLGPS